MKKTIIHISIVIILITIGIIIIYNNRNAKTKDDFIYMGTSSEKITQNENYIFTTYEDYYEKFKSNKLTKKDFKYKNYALIAINYDSCSEEKITPKEYNIKNNNINVIINYKAKCGNCANSYIYYLLPINKKRTINNINITYEAINNPKCNTNVSYKPIIYLYPQKTTNITVKLGFPNLLTTTYPKYNNEWNITATPEGKLIDKNGRSFYGLYWEGINHINNNYNDGFIVKKEQLIPFLEEKLTILGLNEREANEFIIYWLPQLEKSAYNLIRFETTNVINKEMPLNINPKPDTLIRILMEYKPVKQQINIKPQELTQTKRNGFTVIEWGGTLIE